MNIDEIFNALSAPFPTEIVSWRVGSTNAQWRKENEALIGKALAYVDARAVMDRLDAVMGFENWQCNYTPGVGPSIVCNIGLRINGEWIWKADGAGPSDMEADKGALSDAFKRAAVRFGIGRYLYDMRSPSVILEPKGKSGVIPKETYAKLDKLHEDFAATLRKPK